MGLWLEYLISGIAVGCVLAISGSGLVAVYRVTRVINFAQGTCAVIGAFVTSSALASGHLPHGVAEVAGVLSGGLLGWLLGWIAVGKPGTTPIASVVITFGFAIAAYAVEILVWGEVPRSYNGLAGYFTVAGATLQYQYLLIIGVTVLVFGILAYFFARTYLGKGLTACASNPVAATMVGIDTRKMGIVAFVLAGFLGSITGVLIAPIHPLSFSSDVDLAIGGFAAAVFGNLTSFEWALVGGLVVGVAESFVGGLFQASDETIVALLVMVAVMTWKALREGDRSDVEQVAGSGGMGGLVVPPGLRWAGLGVVLVGSAALPGLLSPTNLTVYINACLIILVTTGLTLLMGYAGQFSAGQIAFMVVGGYVTAVLSVHGWPTVVALIAGPVAAAVIAAGIGIPILRLRANYLAFATMAVQLILLNLIGNSPYLGGGSGLVGIPLLGVGAWKIHSLQGYAWLSWAAVVLVVGMTANLIRSRPGRALRALASSEVAAEAAGVAVIRYKIVVFAISAAYAGLAGSIFAFFMGSVNPDAFPLSLSIESIVMVIIGGLGSISGGVLGSLVIVLLLQGLNVLGSAPGMSPTMPVVLSYAVYGVLLMAVVLLLPDGLLRAVTQGLARWGRPQPAVAYPAARDEARV